MESGKKRKRDLSGIFREASSRTGRKWQESNRKLQRNTQEKESETKNVHILQIKTKGKGTIIPQLVWEAVQGGGKNFRQKAGKQKENMGKELGRATLECSSKAKARH